VKINPGRIYSLWPVQKDSDDWLISESGAARDY